jgi:osmotically-inducible protein OsmY
MAVEEDTMTALWHHFHPKQDERIREDILRQLMWQTDIQSREIEVDVKDAVVTLKGYVETRLEKREAENAARAVYGVNSITNNIQVEPKCVRTDREIAADVASALHTLSSVLEELPLVSVNDGVVTLKGKLRWSFQRSSAERAADAVVGARQVRNLIEIQPLETDPSYQPHSRKPQSTALLILEKDGSQSAAA